MNSSFSATNCPFCRGWNCMACVNAEDHSACQHDCPCCAATAPATTTDWNDSLAALCSAMDTSTAADEQAIEALWDRNDHWNSRAADADDWNSTLNELAGHIAATEGLNDVSTEANAEAELIAFMREAAYLDDTVPPASTPASTPAAAPAASADATPTAHLWSWPAPAEAPATSSVDPEGTTPQPPTCERPARRRMRLLDPTFLRSFLG